MKYLGFPLINGFRSQTPRGFYDAAKGHTGIDLSAAIGSDIKLPVPTKVRAIKNQTQMGLTLYVEDGAGNILVLSHLSAINFEVGDTVAAKAVIAKTGNTGTATTGPHLHFEIIAPRPMPGLEIMTRHLGGFNGYNIDPAAYLENIDQPHWSDEAMDWAMKTGLIKHPHDPNAPVTWGEFVVVLHRYHMNNES
jgi:murein DD-endopeptidase MepM/ murein hydrolase activator NlpD